MTKICAFGDSVLKGIVLDNNKYKISRNNFSNICEDTLGIYIENKAKFGSTISVGKKSLSKNLNELKDADYVVFEFGGNDCDFNWKDISDNPNVQHKPNSTIEDFRNTYTDLISKIKDLGKSPVLLSLPPIDAERYFRRISENLNRKNILKWMEDNIQFIVNWHERYNLEVFKLAINNNVPIIDITSKFLEHKNYSQFLCEDGIHPNEIGHEIIAKAIKEHIKTKNIML